MKDSAVKRPSFQFYPGDWLEEIGLRASSLAARGLWADMLCFMHQGEPYGHLRKNGRDIGSEELARMVGSTKAAVTRLLAELEERDVFSRTESGTIYSRRQVRDEQTRTARAEGGKEGGAAAFQNPRASRPGDPRKGGRRGGSEGGSDKTPFGPPPSSPSSSSPSGDGSGEHPDRPPDPGPNRRNPLVADRGPWESECLRLVGEVAEKEGADPIEVFVSASQWRGSRKVNPSSLSEDRLVHTVLDLRKRAGRRPTFPDGTENELPHERKAREVAAERLARGDTPAAVVAFLAEAFAITPAEASRFVEAARH